ncbi:uncharacterized protein [Montipora foliosa]|uniref:uncharacterized protein n=1 Tax=Montipora foliosa TaxID=591990 RepID=UPI0035F14438
MEKWSVQREMKVATSGSIFPLLRFGCTSGIACLIPFELMYTSNMQLSKLRKAAIRDDQTRIKRAQVGPKLNFKCKTTLKTSLTAAVSRVPSKVDEVHLESDDEEVSFEVFGAHGESADIKPNKIEVHCIIHQDFTFILTSHALEA